MILSSVVLTAWIPFAFLVFRVLIPARPYYFLRAEVRCSTVRWQRAQPRVVSVCSAKCWPFSIAQTSHRIAEGNNEGVGGSNRTGTRSRREGPPCVIPVARLETE